MSFDAAFQADLVLSIDARQPAQSPSLEECTVALEQHGARATQLATVVVSSAGLTLPAPTQVVFLCQLALLPALARLELDLDWTEQLSMAVADVLAVSPSLRMLSIAGFTSDACLLYLANGALRNLALGLTDLRLHFDVEHTFATEDVVLAWTAVILRALLASLEVSLSGKRRVGTTPCLLPSATPLPAAAGRELSQCRPRLGYRHRVSTRAQPAAAHAASF